MADSRYKADSGSDEFVQDVEKQPQNEHVKEIGQNADAPTSATEQPGELKRALRSRHMQMIAIGASVGAGLFVGSGSAFRNGGPGSVLIGFMIIGTMLLCTMQALGELAVLYPVNGAFYTYTCRFVDRSWGFAMGWQYAFGWLIVLPFELIAASITIEFWREDIRPSVWISVFLVILIGIQFFGVRGFGEVEFVLSLIKIVAILGFVIFGIVVNVGGVPTDTRGYIGARYWHDPGAFRNGFKGFCSVFVTAAFAFGGTELVGLAAAEAADPQRSLPKATRQVFARIALFYIVTLFILGLIIPSDHPRLLGASGANSKASPFVLAIELAGVKGLPSVMNAVITVAVISVANSCAYASSRTMQALAVGGMAPQFLAYIDGAGRPLWCVAIQLAFGCIAYIGEATASGTIFTWLLAITALSFMLSWMSINLAHIRFRSGWKHAGFSPADLPYQASFGVYGSYLGLFLNIKAIAATFYTSLFPLGAAPDAETFFKSFLAGPVAVALYLFWKLYSREWRLFIRTEDMDVLSGIREGALDKTQVVEGGRTAWQRALRTFF